MLFPLNLTMHRTVITQVPYFFICSKTQNLRARFHYFSIFSFILYVHTFIQQFVHCALPIPIDDLHFSYAHRCSHMQQRASTGVPSRDLNSGPPYNSIQGRLIPYCNQGRLQGTRLPYMSVLKAALHNFFRLWVIGLATGSC